MKSATIGVQNKLTLTFEFPLPATLTLNKQVDLARSHWSTSRNHRGEWKEYLSGLAINQVPDEIKTKEWLELKKKWKHSQLMNPKKIIQFDNPIFTDKTWFAYHWSINSRANDHDNVAAACKFIDDALVAAGIIKDDNFVHIGSYVGNSFDFIPKTKEPKIKTKKKGNSKLFLPEDLLFNPTNQKVIVLVTNDKDNWVLNNISRMRDAS